VSGQLQFTNIQFSYPLRPTVSILNGVTFSVGAGQSVALVGQSGCGKSTLFSLLTRFYYCRHGSITLDGVSLVDLNVEWLRGVIGVVQQEPVIFAASVEENLQMGTRGQETVSRKDVISACKMANAHDFICKLPNGYDTLIGEGGVRLSGGQKQRIAIARALVRNPKVLLLDEATSALDTESEHLVQQALEQAATGRTTINIAHRLSTVRKADRIFVFHKGRVVEEGRHEELMEIVGGQYRQLVSAQEMVASQDSKVNLFAEDEENVREMKEEMEDADITCKYTELIVNIPQGYDLLFQQALFSLHHRTIATASNCSLKTV